METQVEMMILGATAGDTVVAAGNVNSEAGVVETRSPALAPKHPGIGSVEH